VPSRKTFWNRTPDWRNPCCNCAEFPLPLQFSPFSFRFVRLKGSDAYGHNSKDRSDNATSKIGEIVDEKFAIERMTTNDELDYMNRIPTSVTGEQVTRVVQPLLRLSVKLVSCPDSGEVFSSGYLRFGEAGSEFE
jgi:hypothetical protein